MKRPLKVFLYHAPGDKDAVRDLYLRLIQDGVDTRLVKDKLLPSQDWKQEIQGAVREADVVVVCLSEPFNQGESRQREARVAFDTAVEQFEDEILVVVVRLDECDRLDNLGQWPWVDLFEADGYEALLRALQARADRIGANIQRKESLLPEGAPSDVEPGKAMSQEQTAEVTGGILIEGSGVLIDEPVVKLQRTSSRRRWGRTLLVALLGLTGIFIVAVRGSPQLERWYQFSLAALFGKIPGSASGIVSRPIAKAAQANIVFVVDASNSMEGAKIRMVKSVLPDFVSRLNDAYRSSVITFDTHVEIQVDLTREHADTRAALKSITVETDQYGSCIRDALYAGIEQAAFASTAKDARNVVILLSDSAYENNSGSYCGVNFTDDVLDLAMKHSVSLYIVRIAGQFSESSFRDMATQTGGAFFTADKESKLASALRSISEEAGLKLNTEAVPASAPAGTTDTREVPMVFVPPGEFMMGSKNAMNLVTLDGFWIDKTEITNAMYAKCVQAGMCSPPHSKSSRTRNSYYGSSLFANYPVIFVSWADADKYCFWAGGRLPTEAEWEKAARGTYGNPFPWGDDPSGISGFLNYQAQDTVQVGTYPSGASPYGALDMAGNVGEWVADWFSVEYYNHLPASNPTGPSSGDYRVWRGGSWANTSTESLLTYHRTGNLPTDYSSGIGFRCARGADQ